MELIDNAMTNEAIIYPAKFEPSNCSIFVHNEILINASSEEIWLSLVNATTWHEWYSNASKIQILNYHNNYLLAGSKFKWRTFGINLESEIVEFIPHQRLAWKAVGMGTFAYHAWLIIPTENGCKVITEETQYGWLCRLGKFLIPNLIYKYNQIWLNGLKDKSEKMTSTPKTDKR